MCECFQNGANTIVSVHHQKAIMECDEEWAMNKKVVDLSSKDIRQAVSSCFVFYFFVFLRLTNQYLTSGAVRAAHGVPSLWIQHVPLVINHLLNGSQVPRGLPYFAVDFGLQGGFAHVIENEQKFPSYFGKVSVHVSCCSVQYAVIFGW